MGWGWGQEDYSVCPIHIATLGLRTLTLTGFDNIFLSRTTGQVYLATGTGIYFFLLNIMVLYSYEYMI